MYTFEFRPKMAELSPDDKRKTRGKSSKLDDLSSLSKALETYATKCKKDEIRMWQFGGYAEANKSKDSKKSPDFESIVAMQMLSDVIQDHCAMIGKQMGRTHTHILQTFTSFGSRSI